MNIPLAIGIIAVATLIGIPVWMYFIKNVPVKIRVRIGMPTSWLIDGHDLLLAKADFDDQGNLTTFTAYPGSIAIAASDLDHGWSLLVKDLGFELNIPSWWPYRLPPKYRAGISYLVMNRRSYDRMLQLLFDEQDAKAGRRS